MKSEDYIFNSKYTIIPKDSDYKGDIRPGALVSYFIQSAWRHAEELGVGYSHLSKSGVGWVLSRFTIRIHKTPVWPGEFTLNTWPKGVDRILYIRDAELFNQDSIKLASISSAWLIIDMKSKRLKRSMPEAEFFSTIKMRHAIEENIPSLSVEGSITSTTKYEVRYNDIDINMHLTTVRYIDFMFDTYEIDFLNDYSPREITVNFIKEVPFGTKLDMNRYEDGDRHMFELVNSLDEKVYFRGEVKFATRD